MGTAHKVVSACLRVFEFCCAVIILGVLGRFFHHLHQINGPTNSRLVFALSMAAISVLFAIILVPPLKYSFYCFPIDFAIFICWIVCFSLLEDGIYALAAYHKLDENTVKLARKVTWWKKPKPADLEHANGNGAEKRVDAPPPQVEPPPQVGPLPQVGPRPGDE
ncbi:hypothetical protein OQA88_1074 [Cercophora sp. LCS_1]